MVHGHLSFQFHFLFPKQIVFCWNKQSKGAFFRETRITNKIVILLLITFPSIGFTSAHVYLY